MKSTFQLTALFLVVIFFIGCTKNELGGSATVKGVVKHHSKVIGGSRVFIKYNASEFPGRDTTFYDAKVFADAQGRYSFACYKGKYYLYGFGYDDGVPGAVSGGIPINVRTKELLEIDVQVTED
jgi:hypothetical protein